MTRPTFFASYDEARAAAQTLANLSGTDWGLERLAGPLTRQDPWRIFRLPLPQNRSGFELRCEVVRSEKRGGA